MNGKAPVFLSASVPYRKPEKYPADPLVIREAIRAVVAVTVSDRCLVFGGHPAITPLVWDAAASLDAAEMVFVYQSELYRQLIPPQVRFFKNVVWTPVRPGASPKDQQDVDEALLTMRTWMIEQRRVQGGDENAAVVPCRRLHRWHGGRREGMDNVHADLSYDAGLSGGLDRRSGAHPLGALAARAKRSAILEKRIEKQPEFSQPVPAAFELGGE